MEVTEGWGGGDEGGDRVGKVRMREVTGWGEVTEG